MGLYQKSCNYQIPSSMKVNVVDAQVFDKGIDSFSILWLRQLKNRKTKKGIKQRPHIGIPRAWQWLQSITQKKRKEN